MVRKRSLQHRDFVKKKQAKGLLDSNVFYAWICLFLFLIPLKGVSQKNKKDTLSIIRDFISVSTGYKQFPMYLKMEMYNSSNFIMNEEDTSAITAEFFLQKDNSYVRFGELEQIVNDTMALIVSRKDEAMVLFTDAAPVIRQMKTMMGLPVHDSMVRNLSYRYTGTVISSTKELSVIELRSRALIHGTDIPKDVIRVEYENGTRFPKLVQNTRRTTIPLDSARYNEFKGNASLSSSLFAMEGYYFLLKEQVSAYHYLSIQTMAAVKVPVLIQDRVTKNDEGEYVPVKQYENYIITRND